MNTPRSRKGAPGYVSLVVVLSTGVLLTSLTLYAYRRALASQATQAQVQLRVDYSEKEEEILRGIVAIAPNRAIRAMQHASNAAGDNRDSLRWGNIFSEAIVLANARTSISQQVMNTLEVDGAIVSNTGDGANLSPAQVKDLVDDLHDSTNAAHFVTPGLNRNMGVGFPPALNSGVNNVNNGDLLYPIISNSKIHGNHANGRVGLPVDIYPRFNLLEYPGIGFGYARPGDPFVAKRNWWAFSLDAAARERGLTGVVSRRREFVLSIYEIPSQLAISAESFMSLGRHSSGEAWRNTTIEGGVFAGRAFVDEGAEFDSLASRRGMDLAATATIGGRTFDGSPFAPGIRENFLLTEGDFFPVSNAADSGRAMFIPINRGAEFFDRFAHQPEANTLSDTSWNNYSIGAMQAAMRLDVVSVQSEHNPTPTNMRFSYLRTNGARQDMNPWHPTTLPPGFVQVTGEGNSHNFTNGPVDVAYGAPGGFAYKRGVSGPIAFTNEVFGDPLHGTYKYGYWRPRAPMEVKINNAGRICIAVYPERIPAFLNALGGAASPNVNNSLVVNVDYSNTGLNDPLRRPRIPTTNLDYGVILEECANLTPFPLGFSLVTNMRLYIGDDFNIVEQPNRPVGYPAGKPYYPPCSLFAPEKRYGVDDDPFAVSLSGQVGSLARGHKINEHDDDLAVIRPLESRGMSGQEIDADRITVNLRDITHPGELPPISMMNWLVVLEEKRGEFY